MNRLIPTGLATWTATLALLLSVCACLGTAQTTSASYMFFLGTGFLCDASDASTCPATAKAVQGDGYEVSGAGMFDAQNKSVRAAGTFSHKTANGSPVETGVWVASELVNFVSYGAAPNALPLETKGLNPLRLVPMRLKLPTGPMPTGGLAVFRVRLITLSGAAKTGVLQVNCALGAAPQERSVEGIRLSLDDRDEFSEEVSGRVMFLSVRPETSSTAKASENK